MECQGDGFHWLLLCPGHWVMVGYRVACVGAGLAIGSLGLSGLPGSNGLVWA